MKKHKILTAWACVTAVCAVTALPAYAADSSLWAGSPEFARTADKWTALRDNVLQYDEIADLVHEYNVTVQNNRISYDKKRDDDNDDIRNSYMESAQELYSSAADLLTGVDETSPSYAGLVYSATNTKIQAQNMIQQADSDTSDSETLKLQYDQQEATLVSSAQSLMNSYQQLLANLESLKSNRDLLQTTYQSMEAQKALGMITQSELLAAKQNLQTAEAAITSMESNMRNVRQNLCVMTGWNHDANPEIQAIPSTDLNRVASIDLESDKQKAVDQNYSLKSSRRQLTNASDGTSRQKLQNEVNAADQKIRASVASNYEAVLQAKSDYEEAVTALSVEESNMAAAESGYQIGTISALEYQKAKSAYVQAQVKQQVGNLALFQALETYNWSVNGLASTT